MSVEIRVQIDLRGTQQFRRLVREGLVGTGPGPFADMRLKWYARYMAFTARRYRDNGTGGGDGAWPPLALSTIRARMRRHTQQRADVTSVKAQIRALKRAGITGRQLSALERRKRELEGRGAGLNRRNERSSLARDTQNETGRGRGALVGAQQALGISVGVAVTILQDTGTLLRAVQVGAAGNRWDAIPFGVAIGFNPLPHPPRPGAKSKRARTVADIAAYHQHGGKHLPRRTIFVAPDQRTANGMANDTLVALRRALQQSAITDKR